MWIIVALLIVIILLLYQKDKLQKHTNIQHNSVLKTIDEKNQKLIDYLNKKYKSGEAAILAKRLMTRYKPGKIVENISTGPDDTAYTIEKGDLIAICLKDTDGNVHTQDILDFVDLHELAHIISETYGHEHEFWKNFQFILSEAFEAGLYNPQDFSSYPIKYCGVEVAYNPFYDGV